MANELPRVKSERFVLRIKISRGLLPCSLDRERESRGNGLARKEGRYKGGRRRGAPEEILIYTIGVLTSLKNGRLIAQSRIIRGFRVTKPRRGGLYQLDVCANAREKVEKRARGRIRHTGEVVCLEAVMPALVHLVVTSVKCYGRLKGRDGRMRKDTRQEANYNNPSGL